MNGLLLTILIIHLLAETVSIAGLQSPANTHRNRSWMKPEYDWASFLFGRAGKYWFIFTICLFMCELWIPVLCAKNIVQYTGINLLYHFFQDLMLEQYVWESYKKKYYYRGRILNILDQIGHMLILIVTLHFLSAANNG